MSFVPDAPPRRRCGAEGPRAIRDLDGEYQLALWNPGAKTLQLFNDRFGALPLYVGESSHGIAFAGGVRGVLMAPGIDNRPDVDAIKEAVTFGGYRLGARTNVRGVRMVPPATVVSLSSGATSMQRYWTWSELRDGDAADRDVLLNEVREAWSAAIARRLEGARTPGLMLSGGLDSRAILAEAARQKSRDGRHHVRYSRSPTTRRSPHARRERPARTGSCIRCMRTDGSSGAHGRIVETDGLMDLVDLMHTEVFDTMPSRFDVYLSGYIGDAVAGSSLYCGELRGGPRARDAVLRRGPWTVARRRAGRGRDDDRRHAGPAALRVVRAEISAIDEPCDRRRAPVRDGAASVCGLSLLRRRPARPGRNGAPITRSASSGSSRPIRSFSRAFQTSAPVFHPESSRAAMARHARSPLRMAPSARRPLRARARP